MNIIVTGLEAKQVFAFHVHVEDFLKLPKPKGPLTGEEVVKALNEQDQAGILRFLQFAQKHLEQPAEANDVIVINFGTDGVGIYPYRANLEQKFTRTGVLH